MEKRYSDRKWSRLNCTPEMSRLEQLEQRLLLSSTPLYTPPGDSDPGETIVIADEDPQTASAVSSFTAPDSNQYSPRYGQNVGPYDAVNAGTVTLWYTTRTN